MPRSKTKGGYGITPFQSDLTSGEKRALKLIAVNEGVPVGVLVGRAIRKMYGKQMKSSFFAVSGQALDQQ